MQTYEKSAVTSTRTFDFHIDAQFFPTLIVRKPFYTTVQYTIYFRTKQIIIESVTMSPVALQYIKVNADLLAQIHEAARNNAVELAECEPMNLFTSFGRLKMPMVS